MIKGTGVKATQEEIDKAKQLAQEVLDTPLAIVAGKDLRYEARESCMRQIDAMAIAHGLPALGLIDGEPDHYGINPDGEFTRWVPDGTQHLEIP